MEGKYFRIDLVLIIGFLALFCLVLFLCGFYLGLGETFELNRIVNEQNGIRLSGSNPYRDRALRYGFVAVLLIASLLAHSYKRRSSKIIRVGILFLSLFPVWVLFISTPAHLSGNGTMDSSGLNLILYLDLLILPFVVLLFFLYVRNVWAFQPVVIKEHL